MTEPIETSAVEAAEREPEADLLHATGPNAIVLGVIRRRHEPLDGCRVWAHDDIAGLLNIIERAHHGLRALVDERDQLRARLADIGQPTAEQLNPSSESLDAESYRDLRDAIAATMTDDWDGEEAEVWILTRYIRWLAAGQPRDEDGHPIRRETYPADDPHTDLDRLAAEQGAKPTTDMGDPTAPWNAHRGDLTDEEWNAYCSALGIAADDSTREEGGGDAHP